MAPRRKHGMRCNSLSRSVDLGLPRWTDSVSARDLRRTQCRRHSQHETGEGFDFTGRDLAGWCRQVGFQEVEMLPLAGPASAGIAYK